MACTVGGLGRRQAFDSLPLQTNEELLVDILIWPLAKGRALASSVMTHLKVVVRVDVNIMKTSQDILKNDVKCWLLNGMKYGRTHVLTGQIRVLGFKNVFNQYYKICWPN